MCPRRSRGAAVARPCAVALTIFALGLAARSAAAQTVTEPPPSPTLKWDDAWPRFAPAEIILTAVAAPAAIAEYWLAAPQSQPRWTQHNAFDDGVRSALRLRSPTALHVSWTAASVVDVTLVSLSVGIDSVIVPLARGSPDVAFQLGFIDCETFAWSSIAVITLYDNVGRARPSYDDCQKNPAFEADCRTSPTASFPSGHTSQAFTAAGLSCAQHGALSLYGRPTWDALACARDVTLAASEGLLRILGDRHYATDVLVGSGLGFTLGYGLPWLLHYGRRSGKPSPTWSMSPLAARGAAGIVVGGEL
jgi:membrane-associated phospholipid phosphatase